MARKIGIMCDEQYQHLRELLGKGRTINSMDFFDLEETIVIDGKKVEVKFLEFQGGGDFFKIVRIKQKEGKNITVELKHTSKAENYCFTNMPTEG